MSAAASLPLSTNADRADAPPEPPAGPAPAFHLDRGATARAFFGLGALGLAGALAGTNAELASAPASLAAGVGVLLLTLPALVVGQQALGLRAGPGALAGALLDAFARAGVLALGAAPAVLWLAASSDFGPWLATLIAFGAGFFGLLRAFDNLVRAEVAAGGRRDAGTLVALGWTSLAALVGLRLLFLFNFIF